MRVFGTRGDGPQPGILTGNGSVFIGTKGIMATSSRGEGVHLLPAALEGLCVAPAVADALARTHARLGTRLQRRRTVVLGLQHFRARNQRFTNSAAANQYVKPVFRQGWDLKL